MDIFSTCQEISELLLTKEDVKARNKLIYLLDFHGSENLDYSQLVNHLIRETGLYPYMQVETSSWQDRFIHEVFKVDVGGKEATLHREQSSLLKDLINGESIAVSAPTSFGKSFVVDAFIAINKPNNVVIIVPTIALTDETRRRLYKKFGNQYKIITTTEVVLGEKNILIFPQERAVSYVNKLTSIDILIVDEFYKASSNFDKERSPSLLKAIIKLGQNAKQKYFLAPNVNNIKDNVFTQDMIFRELLDFNTVYLEKYELYKEIGRDEGLKSEHLLRILNQTKGKSLIYAGVYTHIDKVSNLLIENLPVSDKPLLVSFAKWLTLNYDDNWQLTNLSKRGTGIHNGQLHRSLSQIQIRLFEEENGFDNIVSTSSIIEGVNTSAENVIVWRNRNGKSKLNDFTYKNIIGRGGRMFKHFIGKIYILEEPPKEESLQLEIPFPDMILGDIDEVKYKDSLTNEQITKIILFREDMEEIFGKESYTNLLKENVFQNSDSGFIRNMAMEMKANPELWNGLGYFNSDIPEHWDTLLLKIIYLQPSGWEIEFRKFIAFVKIISQNWAKTIPQLLEELEDYDIDINKFFMLERNLVFKFSSLLGDVNEIQKIILNNGIDVSPFISKTSHAFLPSTVYQLEEYGLPRMIARKLHQHELINFEDDNLTIHSVIEMFHQIGKEAVLSQDYLDDFDKYIVGYFFEGITVDSGQ
ncbi:MAG: DEAD/DEAH box helicase [Bacteroidota bacterium]